MPRNIAMLLGWAVAALGGAVLIGWTLDIASLKSVFPGTATMKPNTAVCLLLCGGTLALLAQERPGQLVRRGAAAVAWLVIALAALSMAEALLDRDFGLDQFLFRSTLQEAGTSHPGRMSPVTALCLILVGGALLMTMQVTASHFRPALVAALGAAIVVIGTLALAGYMSETWLGYHLWNYSGTAVHTAAGLISLGLGFLALIRSESGLTWWLDPLTTSGFALAGILMVMMGGVSYNFTSQLQETDKWVTHTQEVLKGIQAITSDVKGIQAAQRGYLITADEDLFSRYSQAGASVRGSLAEVRKLTADNARQQHRLDEVEPLIAQRVDWADQTIAAFHKAGFAAAQQMIKTRRGIVLEDQIHALLSQMQDEEYDLLGERHRKSDAISAATFLVLPLGILLCLTLLFLSVSLLNSGAGQRKRAEEATARFAAIVGSSEDAIIGKDLRGIVTSWNGAAEKLFGYSAGEMIGQSIVRLIPTARLEEETGILSRISRGESVRHFETVRLRKDGSAIDVSVTVSAIKDATGRIVGASKVARDITDRKEAEETIHRLNTELEQRVIERTAQLEAANRELEAFSYSVSHDLRAPLRAVDGFSQAVLEDFGKDLPQEGQRYLETIRQAAQRMGRLIDDLLTFSRLSRAPLKRQEVDTGQLVQGVLEDLSGEREGRRIDLRIGELPTCLSDAALLKQVFLNLLSNALKYTRKRETAVIEIGSEGGVYFVRDNGTGFDMRYVDKLFGVFQRLHRAEDYEGTGVGLALVQRIIQRHGGRIWAEAEIDRGASFYFTLEKETKS